MDVMLHYTEQGSGFPLILLHGNGEDGTYFAPLVERFSSAFRVISLDTRGHGLSPRSEAPFTILQFAEDLHDFMDGHDIAKAHLLGFSDGANIALAFALKYPERVVRLVLNAANIFPAGMKTPVYGWVLRHFLKAKLHNDVAGQELMLLMLRQPRFRFDDLKGVSNPTLVIVGDHDMIRDRHSRRIHEAIPDSRFRVIHGSHFCAVEQPEAYGTAVMDFLLG